MIIQLPKDDWVHEPTLEDFEAQKELVVIISEMERERIKQLLSIPPWICPICGLTNFGRNKQCADYRCRYKNEQIRGPDNRK